MSAKDGTATGPDDGHDEAAVECVILVHGTFAAHPADRGDSWFQLGSEFVRDLEARLPPSIRVTERVFHWTGENLESHRQIAAARLLRRVSYFKDTPFHLVGHSHGGGAIWEMLCLAAEYKLDLPNLRSWTTIGAPFIEFTPRKLTLLLTPVAWKWFFLSAAAWLPIIFIANLFINLSSRSFIGLTVFFASGGWLNVIVQSTRMFAARRDEAAEKFGSRGRVITSPEDEVVPFLADLLENRLWRFPRPGTFKPVLDYDLHRITAADGSQSEADDLFRYSYGDELATHQPGYLAPSCHRRTRARGRTPLEEFRRQGMAEAMSKGVIWPLELIFVVLLRPLRHLLAAVADRVVHSRIISFSFGNDTLAYRPRAVSASPHPSLGHIVTGISDGGNKRLLELANRKGASAVSVARRILVPSALLRRRSTPLVECGAVPLDIFVHTSYFELEEVRGIIAAHITGSCTADPDRQTRASEELVARSDRPDPA